MVTWQVASCRAAANALVRAAGTLAFVPTLGDLGTALSHPAISSHRVATHGRARLGLNEGAFRVSVRVDIMELLIAEFVAATGAARRVG